jgi:hypothetical protein
MHSWTDADGRLGLSDVASDDLAIIEAVPALACKNHRGVFLQALAERGH